MTDRLPGTAPASSGMSQQEIEAAREELRKRLPELRKLPGFPNGSDDDIIAMSIPPYYTACPNPFIQDWLEQTKPEGYADRVYDDPGPYASDVSVGKSHPIYKAHSYPTKVPHQAIMRYILHYTKPGDVVLDGFCGTGMTGVAAQACAKPEPDLKAEIESEFAAEGRKPEWGARRAILQDLSPSATFIAAGLNLPIDADAFDKASKEILARFEEEWGWMYQTTHTDGSKAKIDYTVWSEVFTCPHCGGEVVFHDAAFVEATGKVKDSFNCPRCGAELTKKALDRRKVKINTLAGDTIDRIEFRPVKIHYRVGKAKLSKDLDEHDLETLRRIHTSAAPWFPTGDMHPDLLWHGYNFGPRGFRRVHHLFPDRALVALAVLWRITLETADPTLRLALRFWIEQAIWGLSWMNRLKVVQFGKPGGSLVNQYMTGVYYFPALVAECAVEYNLLGTSPVRGKRASLASTWGKTPSMAGNTITACGASESLGIPSESVDYVFVDPPFGLNIPYSDLGQLVEAWHGVTENPEAEAVVHRVRGIGVAEYEDRLAACFQEFARVLKAGGWITVEFSNSSSKVWMALQEAVSRAGFVLADTRVLDKGQGSWIQVMRPNAVKTDIILSAYKPAERLEQRFATVAGSEEGAWEFVREHLSHLPVAEGRTGAGRVARERQGDRLYDRMVAFHVHHGVAVPMTTAEFLSGLDERFPVRDDMYFLPEQVEAYERHRMTFRELAQAELFITSESSAVAWLRQRLRTKPSTFAEIQPDYFRELQSGLPDWEELPDLHAILDEGFLQDEEDRWYVPNPGKAIDLERVRTRALLKEFHTYVEGKGKLDRFRSEAVRAGFREAWADRDFGLIVKVGDRLPPAAFEEDEQLFYYLDNARRLRK